jgi:phenylpropionate dioxygenase-like ring-hydroxylating dioxygenase large terminal subunit
MRDSASQAGARAWVDTENGTVSREIFVSDNIFEQEMKNVFSRAWLMVGHESQIPNPYDFFVSRMGRESVILTRSGDGEIHVFLNTCRHRGMKVCRYDEGNTRVFSCPYHGWSYAIDGKLDRIPGALVGVPHYKAAYHEELDRSAWGLITVPRLARYKGTVWASWDKDAPDFEHYLGGMKIYLDAVLDHRDGSPGGSQVICGIQKWVVPSNWKFGAENFAGDLYHITSHRSVDMVGIGPSGKGRRDEPKAKKTDHGKARSPIVTASVGFPAHGHGVIGTLPYFEEPEYRDSFGLTPEVDDYYREVAHTREKNLGDQLRVQSFVGTVFPNLSFHGQQPRAIFTWHPNGPTEMEVWKWYLVDADAPANVKDVLRRYYLRYAGPAGLTEQDDMENWAYATSASNGIEALRYPYNYQMGMGYEQRVPEIDGALFTRQVTEQNQRIFYERWGQFMDADSWDDLQGAPTQTSSGTLDDDAANSANHAGQPQ